MPAYDFICDHCKHTKEVVCSMNDILGKQVVCERCAKSGAPNVVHIMRRVYGNSGVIFKGSFPGQDIKRAKTDSDIQRQRRKAWLLKDRGDVPQEHPIGLREADQRFDQKYGETDLDAQYDKAVRNE